MVRYGLIVGTLMCATSPTWAADPAPAAEAIPDHPLFRDKFRFSLGGYYPRVASSASLGPSSGGTGVTVDFEETLDLDERSLTPIAEFTWRVAERWQVGFEYFKVSRDASRALTTEIEWGDQVYPIGTTVNSTFDFSDARVTGLYSFFKRRDKELGIGLGLHVSSIGASLDAAGVGAEATDVLAPLPVVNLHGLFALTNEWAVRMRVDWLSLTYGDYSGDVRAIGVDTIYQPFRNFGFGLGVHSLTMDVTIEDPDWRGSARLAFHGPTAFITASF